MELKENFKFMQEIKHTKETNPAFEIYTCIIRLEMYLKSNMMEL